MRRPSPSRPPRAEGALLPRLLVLALALQACQFGAEAAKKCKGGAAKVRKVIIVGAGIAGAAAAHHIATSNPCFKVVVLEARDRVGGRMYSRLETVKGLGQVRAELGGQWLEGGTINPLYKLALRYGLVIGSEKDGFVQHKASGEAYLDADLEAASAPYEKFKEQALAYAQKQDNDISMAAAFRAVNETFFLTPFVQNQVAQDFDFTLGGLDDLSSFHYDDSEYLDSEDLLVLNGYDTIPKRLVRGATAAGAQLKLGFLVTRVVRTAKGVRVLGRKVKGGKRQSFSADAVVVTVPLGVLKAGAIAFSPALSKKKRGALGRLKMAHGTKVALFYETKFWDLSSDEYSIEDTKLPSCRGRFPFWRNLWHPEKQSGLIGYAVGEYALKNKGNSRVLVADARAKVAAMFPKSRDPDNAPLATWVKDWNVDPYALGIYSYPVVGSRGIGDYDILGSPEGRVFFAGEHTHGQYRATVHGAYLSGLREGKRILKSL